MTIPSMLDAAVKRLIAKEPGWKPAPPAPAKGGKAPEVAVGRPASAQQSTGGAGFDETDYTLREYWPTVEINSSDGVFTIEVEPIKSVAITGGAATFKQPV